MAKVDLFKNPIIRFVIEKFDAFPVKRGSVDRKAYEKAIELLNADEVVVVFPEGSRRKKENLSKFKSGAARFALATGSPIVPIGIIKEKKGKLLKVSRIQALVGDIVNVEHLPDNIGLGELSDKTQKLTDKLFEIIKNLLAELNQKY